MRAKRCRLIKYGKNEEKEFHLMSLVNLRATNIVGQTAVGDIFSGDEMK